MNTQILFIGAKNEEYSEKIVYSTIQECFDYLQDKKEIGVDIETSPLYKLGTYKNENIYQPGLDPFLSKIIMLQLGTLEKIFVIDTRTEGIELLKLLFEDREKIFIGANLKFEAKHLQHNYGILFHKIFDVMLVEMNLTNGLGKSKENPNGFRYSLEALAGRYLGIKPVEVRDLFSKMSEEDDEQEIATIDKSIRMGFLTIGDKPFTEKQILYGADDILYPLQIRQMQLLGRDGYNPLKVHSFENDFCLVLADIELNGVYFDPIPWLETYEANLIVYNKRLQKMNSYIETNCPKFCKPPDLFSSVPICAIEWGSSKQVIKFFKELGFCPQEKSKQTKFLEYTVGAKALLKLLSVKYKEFYAKDKETDIVTQEDLILNFLLLSTAAQSCNTFGKEWLKYIHPITGRIHTTFKQLLHTGRLSSNKPNCQQIPSHKAFRRAFVATPGNVLLNLDFSSQEGRDLAEVSGDIEMLNFFNNGHPIHGNDLHSWTATRMFSQMRNEPDLIVTKETHPEERNTAKSISFLIPYGGSAHALKETLGSTEEVAQEFIDGYMNTFPSLKKYFEDGRKDAMKNGYIEMTLGRRYFEPTFEYMNSINKTIWSHFPENYRKMSKEDKAIVKEEVYKEHPEVKGMWSEYFTLKGEQIGRAHV